MAKERKTGRRARDGDEGEDADPTPPAKRSKRPLDDDDADDAPPAKRSKRPLDDDDDADDAPEPAKRSKRPLDDDDEPAPAKRSKKPDDDDDAPPAKRSRKPDDDDAPPAKRSRKPDDDDDAPPARRSRKPDDGDDDAPPPDGDDAAPATKKRGTARRARPGKAAEPADGAAPPAGRGKLVVGAIAVLLLAAAGVAALLLLPRGSPEQDGRDALGSLRRIAAAQAKYRESHPSFGTLAQLGAADLLADQPELASGTRHGYRFACVPSAEMPDYLWVATATPLEPKGRPCWGTDQAGVVFVSSTAPFEVGPKGLVKPADAAQPGPPWVTATPAGR